MELLLNIGRRLRKSQMNLFGKPALADKPEPHHVGETVQGKHGQLIVKKNASGRGGHLEYVSKDVAVDRQKAIGGSEEGEMEEVKDEKSKLNKKYSTDMVRAKAISLETAYNTLSKKEGCKVVIIPKDIDGGMFGNTDDTVEGSLKTVNVNSDGVLNIFIEAEEGEQIIKVPESQAIATGNNRMLIQYKDRDVLIDLAKQPQIIEEDENESVISNETALLPHMVADTVLANKMDVKSAEDEKEFDETIEKLVKLADQEYMDNPKFKKLLNGNKGRDELEVFFEKHIERLLKEKESARTKSQVKNDNQLQIEIMQKAGIPEEEMVNYALSSVADGKILRTYINEVKSGEIDVEEAATRVKNDFDKMKSGEKEGEFIEPSETRKEKVSINKPKLVLNYKKAI